MSAPMGLSDGSGRENTAGSEGKRTVSASDDYEIDKRSCRDLKNVRAPGTMILAQ